MFSMSLNSLVTAYVLSLLAAIGALAIYSELQGRKFRPSRSSDRVFRCEKCGALYTDDSDVDRSRCAQCGTLNEAIEF